MESRGTFIYKGKQKRDAGEFKNDKGDVIKYGESIVVKFDEHTKDDNGNITCDERFIKLKNLEDKTSLIEKLDAFKIYDKITLIFDNKFTKDGGIVLNLIDVEKPTK